MSKKALMPKFTREKILRSAATPRPWYRLDQAEEGGLPEVYIYDQIGLDFWGDGLSPKDFNEDIKAIKGDEFNLRINSPGGFVYDGFSIYNGLMRLNKTINVYIDGIAASIASVIAMAGDRIIIPQNAEVMIHDPWSLVIGNSTDMRKEADDLDRIKESILGIYEPRTGVDRNLLSKMMLEETTMSGEEAFELGFADEIEEPKKLAACAFNILFADNPSDSITNRLNANKKRKLEAGLREAGYSRSEAKSIVSGQREAVPAGNPRDAGGNNGKQDKTIILI